MPVQRCPERKCADPGRMYAMISPTHLGFCRCTTGGGAGTSAMVSGLSFMLFSSLVLFAVKSLIVDDEISSEIIDEEVEALLCDIISVMQIIVKRKRIIFFGGTKKNALPEVRAFADVEKTAYIFKRTSRWLYLAIKPICMRSLGLEPKTYGLKVRCSTN